MFWGWILVYVIVARILFGLAGLRSVSSFRDFLFPSDIYKSQSFNDDIKVIVFYAMIAILALSAKASLQSWFILNVGVVVAHLISYLSGGFSVEAWPLWLVTIVLALALDFSNYIAHALLHQVPWLWEFHKVHHSADYLNPATQFRSHPVEPIFKEIIIGAFTGLITGALYSVKAIPAAPEIFADTWRVSILYYLTFHLRHSHIYFSFGPILSYVFNSPAMHQIHHSIETRHRNKNFAAIFSLWDWLFRTIYIPKSKESFRIGLESEADQREFRGFLGLMWTPFRRVLRPMKEASSL